MKYMYRNKTWQWLSTKYWILSSSLSSKHNAFSNAFSKWGEESSVSKKGAVFVHIENMKKGILGFSSTSKFLDSLIKEPAGDKLLNRLIYDDYPSSKYQTKKELLRTYLSFVIVLWKTCVLWKTRVFFLFSFL